MKTTTALFLGIVMATLPAPSALADAKDDVAAAVKKLAGQSSYQWKTTSRDEGLGRSEAPAPSPGRSTRMAVCG